MARKTKRVNWEDSNQTFSYCGPAPYKFLGTHTQAVNADGLTRVQSDDGLEHWTTPGGTCAVCGTYIKVFYNFVNADGIQFHVGCECAEQAELPYAILKQIDKAKREHMRKLRWAREAKQLEELSDLLTEHDFSEYPHPNKWRQEKGENLSHYIEWMMNHSGTTGKLKMFRILKKIIK
jgi:hypothetical protein